MVGKIALRLFHCNATATAILTVSAYHAGGAVANSRPPRQGGTAALPSSATPSDCATSIPTSEPRQIPAGSPLRSPGDDAGVLRRYRLVGGVRGSGTGTQ